MNNPNSKPVGIAIKDLKEKLRGVILDSGMDPSMVVLVLKDLTQQFAEIGTLQIELWEKGQGKKQQEEQSPGERGE